MDKPRLLIPLVQHFEVRYLIRTGLLARISEFATPVVLMAWDDADIAAEIRTSGGECYPLPPFKPEPEREHVRSRLDEWYKITIQSPSTRIDLRRRSAMLPFSQRVLKRARQLKIRAELAMPGATGKLMVEDETIFWSRTNAREFQAPMERVWRPDFLFCLLPFLSEVEPLLRLAQRRSVPCVTAILSFDNITTRGWIPVLFQRYLLWNKYNAAEVKRCYGVPDETIEIVGAPQFDFYRDPSYVWSEVLWRQRLRLPEGRPVVFFGAGHYKVVPNEPDWLEDLDRSIGENGFSGLPEKPIILFRRHPADPESRWTGPLARCRNVVVDHPWLAVERNGHADVTRVDIEKLASILFHSAVHVNASSTLAVDGAIFDRPQVGPAYDERSGRVWDRVVKELYEREHYLPITRSGGLAIARSRSEFISAIRDALLHPDRLAEGRRKMVQAICTFADGRSTERVANALKTFCECKSAGSTVCDYEALGEAQTRANVLPR